MFIKQFGLANDDTEKNKGSIHKTSFGNFIIILKLWTP